MCCYCTCWCFARSIAELQQYCIFKTYLLMFPIVGYFLSIHQFADGMPSLLFLHGSIALAYCLFIIIKASTESTNTLNCMIIGFVSCCGCFSQVTNQSRCFCNCCCGRDVYHDHPPSKCCRIGKTYTKSEFDFFKWVFVLDLVHSFGYTILVIHHSIGQAFWLMFSFVFPMSWQIWVLQRSYRAQKK